MQIKTRLGLAVVTAALFSTGCAGNIDGNSEELSDDGGVARLETALIPIEVVPAEGETARIGGGYDRVTASLTAARCLTGPVSKSYDNAESRVTVEADVQQSSLDESFEIKASSKASFGLFDGGMRASFAKQTRTDSRSLTFVYKASANLYREVLSLDETSIPAPVRAALSDTDWYSMCGDHFISAIDRGGSLYMAVKLDFASSRDKQAFAASIQARYAGSSVDVSLSNATESFKSRVLVSVYAYQEGGDSAGLAKILPEGEQGKKCLLGDFDACMTFVSSAISYAKSDAFLAGLKATPAASNYYALPYTAIKTVPNAPWAAAAGAIPEIDESRERLVTHMKHAAVIDNRIQALRKANFYGAPTDRRQAVEKIAVQNLKNLSIIQAVRPMCYEQFTPGWGGFWCMSRSMDDYLQSQGFVAVSMADLDINLKPQTQGIRTDFFVNRTPTPKSGDDWQVPNGTKWSPWAMCPKGTFVTGLKLRSVPYQGKGDDTGLQGLILQCSDWDRSKRLTSELVVTPGWGNYIEGLMDTCQQGPLSGIDIRVTPYNGGGDDTGATDLKGICMSNEEINPSGGNAWGNFKDQWTRCPGGSAVCGAAAYFTPYMGNMVDDTGLNNVAIACCAY